MLAAVSLALLPFVRFDFDPLNLKDPKAESVITARDLMKDPMTTPYTAEILAPSLRQADALADRLGEAAGGRAGDHRGELRPEPTRSRNWRFSAICSCCSGRP